MSAQLVIILGDLHIPEKCSEIPPKFKELLVPNKADYVLCTGNIGNPETQHFIQSLAKTPENVILVGGDKDEGLPENRTVKIGNFSFGITHGQNIIPWGDLESLTIIQNALNCDVLIYRNLYSAKVISRDNKFMISPGSLTGAAHITSEETVPSFACAMVFPDKIDVYIYKLEGGELKVSKCTLQKQEE